MSTMFEAHPDGYQCDESECFGCGVRDCPFGEPLHYHHDGCPVCVFQSETEIEWAKAEKAKTKAANAKRDESRSESSSGATHSHAGPDFPQDFYEMVFKSIDDTLSIWAKEPWTEAFRPGPDEKKDNTGEPSWHRAFVAALFTFGGDYSDKESVEHAESYGFSNLDTVQQILGGNTISCEELKVAADALSAHKIGRSCQFCQ